MDKEKNIDKKKEIFEWIYCFIIAVIIAVLIKYFWFTPTIVKQHSMYPNFKPEERLILDRWFKTTKQKPSRGDIITFEAPTKNLYSEEEIDLNNAVAKYENDKTNIFSKFFYHVLDIGKKSYIKRVIGLPGDKIEIKDGKVYVNSEELKEDYLDSSVYTDKIGLFDNFVVPENSVFVMGDNRPRVNGFKTIRMYSIR